MCASGFRVSMTTLAVSQWAWQNYPPTYVLCAVLAGEIYRNQKLYWGLGSEVAGAYGSNLYMKCKNSIGMPIWRIYIYIYIYIYSIWLVDNTKYYSIV